MIDVDRLVRDINNIALAVSEAAAKRSTCCDACGCLIFTWETCPACALANINNHITGATA